MRPLDERIIALIDQYKQDPKYGPNWQYGETAATNIVLGVKTKDYALFDFFSHCLTFLAIV